MVCWKRGVRVRKKVVTGMTVTLLILSMFTFVFSVRQVRASGTIYIRADGSVDPPTAPISTLDYITYTFTDNIYDEIVVERSNIVVDGRGYTVLGGGAGTGIYLRSYADNVTIRNLEVRNFYYGIGIASSSNIIQNNTIISCSVGVWMAEVWDTSITKNRILGNDYGIDTNTVFNITISENTISLNQYGVLFYFAFNSTISGNRIGGSNHNGIKFYKSSDNTLSRNNITANKQRGIELSESSSNVLSGNNIVANDWDGIGLFSSSNHNMVSGNSITANGDSGILLGYSSSYNSFFGNNIANNDQGIYFYESSTYNSISGNDVANNIYGVMLHGSSGNIICHNNFVDNTDQVYSYNSTSVWDEGYPSGGNYWSDYTGTDLYSGPYQNVLGGDGIGDIPYVIDVNNRDNYPLMEPWSVHSRYPWPMFRHDARHTGYTKSPAPNTNQTQWTYTTGDDVGSSPAVAIGKVYIGSFDGKVYCLDAYTGVQIWNYTTGGPVAYSSPAVADSKVYVGSNDKKIYCLDALTGTQIWNYTTGAFVFSSPAVADGKVYVGSIDNKTYCLDALTGALIWNYTTDGWVGSSPAAADGKVYVGSNDNRVYCLDALTGTLIWNYTTGGGVGPSPAVADGKVYVGSIEKNVYCLDALTGMHIWNYTTGGPVGASPAVANGKVYVGSYDNNLYCLDALTGTQIWNYTTGAGGSSPAVADGKVYVGSIEKNVYCLDALTGALIWNYVTGFSVVSSPAVADGMVFVGSYDNKVYAFGNVIRTEDYPTIQDAIDDVDPGATIIIAPGTYYNQSLVINKTLTIIGLPGSAPIFDGGGSGTFVTLLPGASGTTITGIVVTNWDQGIFFANSSNCKIYGNIMSLMDESGIVLEGSGTANNLIYNNIFQGNKIAINLTRSSLNMIYHNNFVANTNPVHVSSAVYVNIWDNGYPSGGNYWSDYTDVDLNSDGIWDHAYVIDSNNRDRYPLVKPFRGLAVTKVTTSKTVIGQGFTLSIDVTILNHGVDDEVSTVNIYANTTIKASLPVTLTNRNFTQVTFLWNTMGVAKGNYTITVKATPVLDETDITDNTYEDGWIVIALVGDINADGIVDISDIYLIALAFGAMPPEPRYDPNLDIIYDQIIDISDIYTAAIHFGETDP